MITICGLFRCKHERSPIPNNGPTAVRNSSLSLEVSYGLERVNDFRYNSR